MLHIMPVRGAIEQEEIKRPDGPRALPSLMREWEADNDQQIIMHVATGGQFRAYPVALGADGLITPFARKYIAVRFVGMKSGVSGPPAAQIRELGQQGIEWILTYTFEARR